MGTAAYKDTALNWTPVQKGDRAFVLLASLVLALLLGIALVLSSIDLPEEARQVRTVPQRIVQFVEQRPKPKPEPPRPEPVQIKPPPEPPPELEPIEEVPPEPEPPPPEVEQQPVRKPEERPALTDAQQQARARVQNKGLLGLRQGFDDILDTAAIDELVAENRGAVNAGEATQAATVDNGALLAAAGRGSGGVANPINEAVLGESRLAAVDNSGSNIPEFAVNSTEEQEKTSGESSARAAEDLKLVFDQNKSQLHTLYNRERRRHPGLKGRIVLELTIDAEGKVVTVAIVSSELGNEALERRLVARIKQFEFGPSPLGTVTVTYPIEFLPS